MNKIVREHYPVSKLPEDLRVGLRPDDAVRIVIETLDRSPTRIEELFARARQIPGIGDDPVERIRKLRDEWD